MASRDPAATPLYVKHPVLEGDGEISIATPDGVVTRRVVAGVLEWPAHVPLPNRFVEAPEPEALRRAKEAEERQALAALAAKFGLRLVAASDADAPAAAAPAKTPRKR
jgi:hypothetical protein